VIETAATVICFGSAALSVVAGLSPLVGAFAAGMGLAGSRAVKRVKEYVAKISLIFIPVLFASMGVHMDLASFLAGNEVLMIVAVFFVTEFVTKIVGYGFLVSYVLTDRAAGTRVGLAMTCMGEEGMLVLTIGLSHSLISSSIYTGMMLVSLLTTIITPLILKPLYAQVEPSDLKATEPSEKF
jgi:Kef-type K+ transport system membrane component KefB